MYLEKKTNLNIVQNGVYIIREVASRLIKKNVFAAVSLIGTPLALICFCIGYLFSYGYYFGGDEARVDSLLEVLIKPVPFDFKPVIVIGLIFLSIIVLCILLLKSFKKDFIFTCFLWVIFHVVVTSIFIGFGGHINILEYAFFGFIWILPLLTYGMIRYFMIAGEKPLFILSGASLSVILLWIVSEVCSYINGGVYLDSWGYLLFMLTLFFAPIFLNSVVIGRKCSIDKIYYLLLYPICIASLLLGMVCVKMIFGFNISKDTFILSQILLLAFPSVPLFIFKKRILKKIAGNFKSQDIKVVGGADNIITVFITLNKNIHFASSLILISMLFMLLIMSYVAVMGGHSIRTCSLNAPNELIKYNFGGKTKEIEGRLVTKRDNIYYLSDKTFNLIMLKANEFETTELLSIRDLFKYEDEYKWLEKVSLWDFEVQQLDDDPELEVVIYKGNNLMILDRDSIDARCVLMLIDAAPDGYNLKDKLITINRQVKEGINNKHITEKYKLENRIIKKIE